MYMNEISAEVERFISWWSHAHKGSYFTLGRLERFRQIRKAEKKSLKLKLMSIMKIKITSRVW